MTAKITYLNGDATHPVGDGPKIIAHVCNNLGGWGAGFVLALSKRWTAPEARYRNWHKTGSDEHEQDFELGSVDYVPVESDLFVANMVAQEGYGPNNRNQHRTNHKDSRIPLRYEALRACLEDLALRAKELGASVHMPRIGCSLAGGSWAQVVTIIEDELDGLNVFVYDYPGGKFNP